MKKALSIFLILTISAAMLFTSVQPASAETKKLNDVQNATNEITVKGTNSAGELVSQSLEAKQKEQLKNDGHNIYEVKVSGKKASASFETTEACTLLVAIYDENGKRMLASGKKNVAGGDTKADVMIETDSTPKYFYVKAFLIDSVTLKPLCTMYESPNYTREMQEFFETTTDDFKNEEVLNFDKDKSNNFAVYDKETKIIEKKSGKNIVEQINEKEKQYAFTNVDEQITSLKPGDVFAYEYEQGNTLIIKVNDIKVSGTKAVITEEDTSLEEVFDYVKIDTESTLDNAEIDASNLEKGLTYKGLVKTNKVQPQAIDVEDTVSKSMEYKVDKKVNNTTLSGSLFLNMEANFKLHLARKYKYVELKFQTTVGVDLYVSAKLHKEFTLTNKLQFSPFAGITITVNPKLVMDFSGKIQFNGKIKSISGASYSNNEGYRDLTGKPVVETELTIEGQLYVGLVLEPAINVIHEDIFSIDFKAEAGAKATANNNSGGTSETSKHTCRLCLAGDITFQSNLNFSVRFLKKDLVNQDVFTYSAKIKDFYYSVSHKRFGWGTCPFISYRVLVLVKDDVGRAVTNASVNGTELSDKTGKAILWLENGTHAITVKKKDYQDVKQDIYVENGAQTLTIILADAVASLQTIQMVSLGTYHSAAVTKDGDLYTWGLNASGQLGDGTTKDKTKPIKIMDNVKKVSLGGVTSAAVTKDGSLYTWGGGDCGALGNGAEEDSYIPVKIMDNVEQISIGYLNGAAVTQNGELYSWGYNDRGQLGNGTREDCDRPMWIMDDIKMVYCGDDGHSAAVTKDGDLYLWGDNFEGELGDGTTKSSNRPVKVMENVKDVCLGWLCSSAITADGSLYTWGNNWSGQLGTDDMEIQTLPTKILDNIITASLGESHGAAVTEDGKLYTWGSNVCGQIGKDL